MDRFTRTRKLLGEEQFARLQASRVTIVGLGAVGGYVMEGLTRAGVSHLRLIDFDVVAASNINRQLLALETTVGRPKVDVAKERVLAINSCCEVESLQMFASEETVEAILTPLPDLLIDAIDSLNPKSQLLHGAYMRNVPTISSMGAALRTDPSLIRIGDLFDTAKCPLARHLRKRLRRMGVGQGIETVYSTEKIDYVYEDEAAGSDDNEPATEWADRGRKRHVLGSLPTITGIFGLMIANMAIMRLART
jgi:tRNA A37 threonylcarbamoyladenosine dehydratase